MLSAPLRLPLMLRKVHALPAEGDPFSHQERPLEMLTATVAAEATSSGNHAVRGGVRAAAAHDVADGARSAWPAGDRGHLAVGGDAPWRDASHHRQHPSAERRGRVSRAALNAACQRSASFSTRPSAFGNAVPLRAASVGATSAGEAGASYLPGFTP